MIYRYPTPLLEGRFLERRKRFFIDLLPASNEGPGGGSFAPITVHCPNTGSMRSCLEKGAPILYSDSMNPARKLRFTAELIHGGRGWIGIHTGRTNALAAAVFQEGLLPGFGHCGEIRREPVLSGGTRVDLLLRLSDGTACYVEVKNVTYFDGRHLAFPDARSVRAARHARELARLVGEGFRACLLFVASRPEGEAVRPASEIDPDFAEALQFAAGAGVEVRSVRIDYDREGATFGGELPVVL